MTIKSKLSTLIGILFTTAILNSGFTFWLERLSDNKLSWTNHTNRVIILEAKLMASLVDMETGQRGYLLTEDPSYLGPYHRGLETAKENYKKLKKMTSDNVEQQEILDGIKDDIDFKYDELAKTIELIQSGNRKESIELVIANEGKYYMDNIRAAMTIFVNNELVLLEERKGDYREHRAKFITLLYVQITLFLGLGIITFLFLEKSLFSPLYLLIRNSEKVEKGEKLKVEDILEKDEMGHLLSSFYEMGSKVYSREQTLKYEVKHDDLTGLKNRSSVIQELDKSLEESKNSNSKTATLFLDLNSFKQINDSLGHNFGDLVLKEVAKRLKASIRSTDGLFRLGGDEFLIILDDIKDVEKAIAVADKIQGNFKKSAKIEGKSIDLSVSIGIAISPDNSIDSQELIEFADVAMYISKQEKTTKYKLFEKDMINNKDYQDIINNLSEDSRG